MCDRLGKQFQQRLAVCDRSDDSGVEGFGFPVRIDLSEVENHLVLVVANSKNIRVPSLQEFRLHKIRFEALYAREEPTKTFLLFKALARTVESAVTVFV